MRLGSPLLIALGGMTALAAAMGIGRFLYTPLLPMMVAEGLSPASAGALASANFAGYLVGALAAGLVGQAWRGVILALAISAATTGAMAWTDGFWVWAVLRFLGGAASAFTLVLASSVVVAQLRAHQASHLGALHFAGVGLGIALSAILVPWAGEWRAAWAWGGAATVLALCVSVALLPRSAPSSDTAQPNKAPEAGFWRLVLAYGCLGFGYVITATFIVALLRDEGGTPQAEMVTWLIVGLSAAPSVAFWLWVSRRLGFVTTFAVAMGVEAAGVALSAVSTGPIALTLSALALGGTFMGLTALGLQEAARRLGPGGSAWGMGLMTASFGTGQMIGPMIAGTLRQSTGSYVLASLLAAGVLVLGAGLVLWQSPPRKTND